MDRLIIEPLLNFKVPQKLIESLTEEQADNLLLWCNASSFYYDGEELILTDTQFDELQEQLLSIDNDMLKHFIKSTIYRNGIFEPAGNDYVQEMISLFKIKLKEHESPVSKINTFFKNYKGILKYSPKLDGCSLKVTFNGQKVVQIITRGGIDVTHLFKDMYSICEAKRFGTKIICGELVINKNIFAKKYSSEVGGEYENPRNFVGGLVKRKELPKSIIDDLEFVPCTDGINTLNSIIWQNGEYGSTNDWMSKITDIIKYYKGPEFPYLCDGIVVAYDEPDHIRKVKDNYPLNMVAIKFPAPRATTKVIGFDWTQKKSGKLTPRLMVDPVKLDGSTISYTNGYNIDQVLGKGVGIGAIVEIEKSGDIIPVIVKVLKRSNNVEYPKCDYKRVGKHLIAIDKEESKIFKFIAALRILQIQGIGDTLAEQIGHIVDFDILKLFDTRYKPEISKCLGGGANWINFSELYNIHTLHIDEVINLLQFDNVGPKIAKKIAYLILKMSNDTKNISSDVLVNVCRGEGYQRIKDALTELKSYGIQVLKPIVVNDETLTFEMSGNPKGMTKSEFEKKLKEVFPNAIHTSLTKDTKYLIVDDLKSSTSKALKARKYNIKIVTYEEALKGNL